LLTAIDVSVRKGEILGLVGLVGSGRSGNRKRIFGSIDGGYDEMRIYGKAGRILDTKDAISKGLRLPSEIERSTALCRREHCKKYHFAAAGQGFPQGHPVPGSGAKYGLKYMESLNIKANSERDMVTSLSGGNQQKVVLAKWLMADPMVLMLDEPTRGIDVGAKAQIYQIMTELVRQGMAIIMISSELTELVGMCDRYLLLADGKIRAELGRDQADEERFLRICSGSDQ
jgi:ABC-type sugar transport system ATPase subunit